MTVPRRTIALLGQSSWAETRRIAGILRKETIGGALLLVCTVAAMIWANSPWSATYESLRRHTVGPAALHLDLDLVTWAADGLLAIFFFVAGLELKREFVAGDLRDPRRAAVPVAAAVGGVIVPALLYVLVNLREGGAPEGWAIPTATDIAFALAVLAVIGRSLPSALRTFLLTLAVVDDLLAIVIIAVFYTAHLSVVPLLAALLPLAAFATLVRRGVRSWWLLLPVAAATWALVHASGVHATVAGVLLAFTVPVAVVAGRRNEGSQNDGGRQDPGDSQNAGGRDGGGSAAGDTAGAGERTGLAEHFEHRFRPISAGIAVPLFAFLSAGVSLGRPGGLSAVLADPVAAGVAVGLVAGKPLGIMAATWLVARFTRAGLHQDITWLDVAGLAILSGIGFTVSLLIGELSFGAVGGRSDAVKVAVLTGSLVAALLATVILRLRDRAYRRMRAAETAGRDDGDGGLPTTSGPPATD